MINSILRRFDIVTYKDKSGSDTAQVPTAATVDLYKQGATSLAAATITTSDPDATVLPVQDIGAIVVNDQLGVNLGAAKLLVNAVDATHVTVSAMSSAVTVDVGDRLVVKTSRPVAYSDSKGATSIGSTLTASASTGRISCYVREKRFDYIVSGTVSPSRMFIDAEGGNIPESFINAADFPSIQSAIDALPIAGGTVYIPAGDYTLTATLLLPLDRPLRLLGAGRSASRLNWSNANIDYVRARGSNCTLSGLSIVGPYNTSGAGRGVVIGRYASEAGSGAVRFVTIEDCDIVQIPSWGLYALGDDDSGMSTTDPGISILCTINRCGITYNRGDGLVKLGRGCTTYNLIKCSLGQSYGIMLWAKDFTGLLVSQCAFEGTLDDTAPFVKLENVRSAQFENAYWENGPTSVNQYYAEIVGTLNFGIEFGSCHFTRHAEHPATQGMSARLVKVGSSATVYGLLLENLAVYLNATSSTGTSDIDVESSTSVVRVGMVSIGDNAVPDRPVRVVNNSQKSCYLNLNGKLHLPTLTTSERDNLTDVTKGDLIYNLSSGVNKVQVYDGSTWVNL